MRHINSRKKKKKLDEETAHIACYDPTKQKWWRFPTLTDTGMFLGGRKGCSIQSPFKAEKRNSITHAPEEFEDQALEKQFDLENVWMKEDEKVGDGLRSSRELLTAVNDA